MTVCGCGDADTSGEVAGRGGVGRVCGDIHTHTHTYRRHANVSVMVRKDCMQKG